MADHEKRRNKRPAIAIAVAIAVVAVVGVAWALAMRGSDTSTESPDRNPDGTAPSEIVSDGAADEPADNTGDSAALPFSLKSVPSSSLVIEASDCTAEAPLTRLWSFGGDYAHIGSFPLSSDSVFGSQTDDPDDIEGYVASVLSDGSSRPLEQQQTSDKYFEPQDGSGTADLIVWRSSELINLPGSGVDNWRVQAWSAASGRAILLGTAESLNGTSETPMLDGEIVPTVNDSRAFFASFKKAGDTWRPAVVSWKVGEESGDTTEVGEGSYPAATDEGCIWASSPDYRDSGTFYGSLSRWDGSQSSEVFSIASGEGTWGISGTWASASRRVVGFSSDDPARGSYLGFWNADFSECLGWVHIASPRAVGSLNDDYFVWGAGSEADNAQMYALRLDDMTLSLLGSCPGYSRPSIAASNNTVMIPVSNGSGAVSYDVVSLG